MRCRQACRELLWLSRFGELGPSSQPHLDHLSVCRTCRDQVGFDRAMVEQLRIALAERVANADPPLGAWEGILARARSTDPPRPIGVRERSAGLVNRLRWATTMAGTSLALMLALNMEIVPVSPPPAGDGASAAESPTLQQVPRMPLQRSSLAQIARQWGGAESTPARPDPEAALHAARVQPARPVEAVDVDSSKEEATAELRLVFRPLQTPEPGPARTSAPAAAEPPAAEVVESDPGEPS